MDKKVTGIVCYLTFIGWLVAYFAGDREGAKFQLNQTLVLTLANLILSIVANGVGGIFGVVCWVLNIVLIVLWIIGFIGAIQGEDKPIPFFSTIQILK